MVIIHRCTIKCRLANFDSPATSFEYLATFLSIHSSCFLLLVIYRPPSSNLNLFISEFSTFFELLAIAPGKLIISGDFNIHVDKLCPVSTQFLSLIDSFDVQQHVCEHTHIHGHFLDLVLSRAHEKPIVDLFLSKLISDHFAVHWLVRAHRPSRSTESVKCRKLNSIDHSSFCSDLANLPLVINTADDCESILHQYDIGLTSTLERHVPVINRTFTVRPDNPWDSEDVDAAKRFVRKLERRWKVTRLSIDKELMQRSLHSLREKIYHAKSIFLNSKIVENREKKSLS